MSGQNYLNAEKTLELYLEEFDKYIILSSVKFASLREEHAILADMSHAQIDFKTKNELFNCAYSLYNYSNFVQDEVSKNRVILNWCNNQLNLLLAKHRDDYGFTKYTKHESKLPVVIIENSYAAKVNEIKQSIDMRLQVLEGKVFEIKRLGDVIFEKAKRL